MIQKKPLLLSFFLSASLGAGTLFTQPAEAANWLAVQMVSPPKAPLFTVSGFIEPTIWAQNGTVASAVGETPHINLIAPGFSQSTTAGIMRARIMFRGNLNHHISYFFGGEFGNNGFTHIRKGYQPGLIDGHVTFSYIPGARVEVGLIRTPGALGAIEGVFAYNYVLSPTMRLQLLNQHMIQGNSNYIIRPNAKHSYLVPGAANLGTSGYRNPGIMVGDWFRSGHWETSYYAMLGMYGTVAAGNQSGAPMEAVRLQEAYVLSGKGPFRSDIQGGIWYQHARPRLLGHGYDMNRYGVDASYSQGYMHPWGRMLRFSYVHGSGWIFAPAPFNETPAIAKKAPLYNSQIYPGIANKAWGYMVEGGLFFTKNIEMTLRYDLYNRLPNDPAQNRIFKDFAVGLQYHFTPKTKIMAGYYFRTLDVPHPNDVSSSVASSVDNLFAMQAIISF
ncbi:porin [Acidithiobacillus marinus]|uniref:Porin n=1 Tax=Acidithiobacillus marinus TaxID=187490 RepID=A0A2I1DKH9_9PROT|nr:porin [Acidithiobacillus marinus]PKY10387.1 porin [Acidithiobacillus marinus]